jgi:hypothetical protein
VIRPRQIRRCCIYIHIYLVSHVQKDKGTRREDVNLVEEMSTFGNRSGARYRFHSHLSTIEAKVSASHHGGVSRTPPLGVEADEMILNTLAQARPGTSKMWLHLGTGPSACQFQTPTQISPSRSTSSPRPPLFSYASALILHLDALEYPGLYIRLAETQ